MASVARTDLELSDEEELSEFGRAVSKQLGREQPGLESSSRETGPGGSSSNSSSRQARHPKSVSTAAATGKKSYLEKNSQVPAFYLPHNTVNSSVAGTGDGPPSRTGRTGATHPWP